MYNSIVDPIDELEKVLKDVKNNKEDNFNYDSMKKVYLNSMSDLFEDLEKALKNVEEHMEDDFNYDSVKYSHFDTKIDNFHSIAPNNNEKHKLKQNCIKTVENSPLREFNDKEEISSSNIEYCGREDHKILGSERTQVYYSAIIISPKFNLDSFDKNKIEYEINKYSSNEIYDFLLKSSFKNIDCDVLAKRLVKKDGRCLRFFSHRLKNNQNLIIKAIKNTPSSFLYVPDTMKRFRNILKCFLIHYDESISIFLNCPHLLDRTFCIEIMKENGLALKFFKNFNNDKYVVKLAVKNNPKSILYIGNKLLKNSKFNLQILNTPEVLQNFNVRFLYTHKILLRVMEMYPDVFKNIKINLLLNRIFIKLIIIFLIKKYVNIL